MYEGNGATSFDYVIVGAGSAGCVIAARLSADPSVSVLLVEAGPPDDAPGMDVPILAPAGPSSARRASPKMRSCVTRARRR